MRKVHARKLVSLLFCVLLIALSFSSMVLAGTHAEHSCAMKLDHACSVCLVIHSVSLLLRQLVVSLGFAWAFLLVLRLLCANAPAFRNHRRTGSLVALKVRLNP